MKIAVSTADEVSICGHLGRCSKFFIYEIENGAITSRELREVTPVHGPGHGHHHDEGGDHHSAGHMAEHGGVIGAISDASAVITNGMGSGFAESLKSAGIEPIVTNESDPQAAVQAYLDGTLNVKGQSCCNCGHHH